MRRIAAAIVVVVIAGGAVAAIGPVRRAALRQTGGVLTAADTERPADLLTLDVESGLAGALKLADLHRANRAATVGLLVPRATTLDRELTRRGIVLPDLAHDVLVQSGIPGDVMVRIPAGEGGTTETTSALGEWARTHSGKTVLVVVGPSHGRRYRRALRRAWPDGAPPPIVVTTPYAAFHQDTWWRSRTTLREGLVELEKLALDLVQHPF